MSAPDSINDDAEQQAVERRAVEYGLRFLTAVPDGALDPSLVARVPVDWARSNLMLPVRLGEQVCALTANPDKLGEQQCLALLIGHDIEPVLAAPRLVLKSIERCYYSKKDSPMEFLQGLDRKTGAPIDAPGSRAEDLLAVAEHAPVTQLINLILLEAVKKGASDIHFEPFESRLRVRYRVDGILYEQTSPPKSLESALVSRLKVMARLDIAERRLPQDGMARVRVGEREIDIRVATAPVAEGERVALRILDRDSALLPLNVLGLGADTLESTRALLALPNGMVVVCGPTGSGKTTTLYAALSQLDSSRKNIITIEDPIEYQIADIGQIQVKPKIGLTFATGLRHILRQDPDVVLVGETRDLETAEIAVRASLTGHLVFTTLHTNDAPAVVLRLTDMGIESYLVAACLRAALAQRLVRRLCRVCRRAQSLSEAEAAWLGPLGRRLTGRDVYHPAGCPECLEGYRGRVGLFELMVVDREARDFIRSSRPGGDELRQFAEKRGMRGLMADGMDKILDGTTSPAEVQSALG
ncbi:MAG: GspE/PulE family protein [Verrucomicrobiota bacterium]|nr:GspE/PulE family protein [Verrucomicrobiota bacterium]